MGLVCVFGVVVVWVYLERWYYCFVGYYRLFRDEEVVWGVVEKVWLVEGVFGVEFGCLGLCFLCIDRG